jgi:transcriptional regulator with XRE-family HTH domain
MPRTLRIRSFLSSREQEICARLREIRVDRRLTQAEFSERVGISRVRLSSYEYAKAPVRFALAREVCFRFDVNQRWFATGVYPNRPYFDISPHLECQIDPRALFSEAWDKVLKTPVEQRFSELPTFLDPEVAMSGQYEDGVLDNFSLVGEEPARATAFYVARLIKVRLAWLEGTLLLEYAKMLLAADRRFAREHQTDLKRFKRTIVAGSGEISEVQKKSRISIDRIPLSAKKGADMSEIGNLLDRIKKLAAQPGKKAALAKFLDVPQSRIWEWLSGKYEPGGEIALRLLSWVEAESAKQNPRSATNTARANQTRKVPNENQPTSSPKEK